MKKKQTKAEKKAAKRAKLDPANHKTAKDVADERDRKRRLEEEEAERAAAGLDGPMEQPMEGIKQPKAKAQKTAKDQDVHSKSTPDTAKSAKISNQQPELASKEDKRKAKETRRKEKQDRKAAKVAVKKAKKQEKTQAAAPIADNDDAEEEEEESANEEDDRESEASVVQLYTDMDAIDVSGLVDEAQKGNRASSSRSASPDLTFSPYHNGTISSTSSIQTPNDIGESSKPAKQRSHTEQSKPTVTEKHETPEEAKARKEAQIARLQALIEEKRKARNADGLNGRPARSRTELIEARRLKEQQRKEKKKELRAQEKEQQKKAQFEAHLASLRGSPVLGAELFAPRSRSASVSSPSVANNTFSFGRVAFTDGARMNSNLSGLAEKKKQKGPSDAKTALLVAEKHQARLNSLDEAKRADIEEKDMWLNARKRINGEKVRDDVNLLKKSLKRKEKGKSRSEKQWGERIEGVKKSQEARQRKREENIAKRKEEKGAGKGKKKGTGAGVKKKPKRRAGFEGTMRGRA
jgi:hypothetical protein